jgi:3-oxoacyl-[acyl-carrier protein] reductase
MWSGEIENLYHQYSNDNLRVNTLSPGVILTEYHINRIKNMAVKANRSFDEQLTLETKDLPSRKYGEPKDVADVVGFLLSKESKHMNCENIVLNGGGSKSY